MKLADLKVDDEFKNIIPALSDEEFEQLESNILSDCEVREPLVTWNGTILDGHNRYAILLKHPDIPYKISEMIFFSRFEAKEWMIKNQLGRRNISYEERKRLIGKMQENRKQAHGGDRKSEESKVQNEPLMKSTAAQIAEETGVSESTVKRAEKFSKGIDSLQDVSPKAAQTVLKGGSGVKDQDIEKLPFASPKEIEEYAQSIIDYSEAKSNGEKVEKPTLKSNVESRKAEPIAQHAYTIDNLISEVNASAENYVRFLKQTLANRSTIYADQADRKRVYDAISNLIIKIEDIQKIIE